MILRYSTSVPLLSFCLACIGPSSVFADKIASRSTVLLDANSYPHAIAFSPDGSRFAIAYGSHGAPGVIRIYLASNRRMLATLRGHRQEVYSLAFAPDSKLLVSGGKEAACLIWNTTAHKQIGVLSNADGLGMSIATSPNGKHLAVVQADNNIAIWNLAKQRRVAMINEGRGEPRWVTYHPDGKHLIVATNDRRLYLMRLSDNAPKPLVDKAQKDFINAMAVNRQGTHVATCGDDGVVNVWELATGLGVAALGKRNNDRNVTGVDEPLSLAYSPNGSRLAVGFRSGSIVLYNTTVSDFSEALLIKAHKSGVSGLSFSPDGTKLLSSSFFDTSVILWSIQSD